MVESVAGPTALLRDSAQGRRIAEQDALTNLERTPLDALLTGAAGCKEALFTLGDKPELRYAAARQGLAQTGVGSTLEYLERAARLVLVETGLLPHLNPGVMSREELIRLRPVAGVHGLDA